MKNTILSRNLHLLIILLSFCGCKKDLLIDSSVTDKISIKKKTINTISPYVFDWEHIDYMPAPTDTKILVPWASGANKSFPSIYATDIKSSDGWQLVYNTFSPTSLNQPLYFVLYNKYRGLLRGYFYLTPGSSIPSSNITHALVQDVSSNSAPLLSYSASEVANLSINTPVSSTVQQYKTSATGTWYAAEFEMAYDPTIANKNTSMSWQVSSINTSNIILNGTSKGNIQGTISQSKPASNLLGNTIPGILTFPYEGIIDSWKLPTPVTTALKTGLTSGLGGIVKNVLNGIFGGTDQSNQYANLTTSAQYSMDGTITDVYQLQNPNLLIPGSSGQTSTSGYAPLYTNPLGVFSLSAAPKSDLSIPTWEGSDYDVPDWSSAKVTLDTTSYKVQFNPSVINGSTSGASIRNFKQQIISFKNYFSINTKRYNYNPARIDPDSPIPSTAITEQVDNTTVIINDLNSLVSPDHSIVIPVKRYIAVYGGGAPSSYGLEDTFVANSPMPSTILRISFDVVPNNGAPKTTIVKSFNIIMRSINYVY